MSDLPPVEGPDIWARASRDGFGTTSGRVADGIPTIELDTDLDLHGPHGAVMIRCVAAANLFSPAISTDASAWNERVEKAMIAKWTCERGSVVCSSQDAIRFWGRFSPESELAVASRRPVRLVARARDGAILAGPLMVSADTPPMTLSW
jgi:hypothetical protein